MSSATQPDKPGATSAASYGSFREIFDAHARFVWRSLLGLGVPENDVPDASQQVFVVLQGKLDQIDEGCSVSTFAYGICLRVASDFRRRAHVRREQLCATPPERPTSAPQEGIVSHREALGRLRAVLDAIDPAQREVFVLYEIEELAMAEVARAVGCPPVVVWHAANKSARGPAAVVAPTRVSPGVSRQRPELPDPMQNPASELAAPRPAQSPPSLAAGAHPMLAPEPIVAGSPRADHRPVTESTARWTRPSREPAVTPPPAASSFRKFEASEANSGESASGTVDEELALLVRANRALVKSPALALTLADEHTRRFPASGMDQECELIAIAALVDLGQTAEAHRRAAQFTRAHPGSIYQPRIDKALAPRH
jgi:RNA polymerase sigma-70 factor (ECF subfamily)